MTTSLQDIESTGTSKRTKLLNLRVFAQIVCWSTFPNWIRIEDFGDFSCPRKKWERLFSDCVIFWIASRPGHLRVHACSLPCGRIFCLPDVRVWVNSVCLATKQQDSSAKLHCWFLLSFCFWNHSIKKHPFLRLASWQLRQKKLSHMWFVIALCAKMLEGFSLEGTSIFQEWFRVVNWFWQC